MPKAIRIDNKEVITVVSGDYHLEAILEYQAREGLTDDQMDDMLDQGRIEFGSVWMPYRDGVRQPWEFCKAETKTLMYDAMSTIYSYTAEPDSYAEY